MKYRALVVLYHQGAGPTMFPLFPKDIKDKQNKNMDKFLFSVFTLATRWGQLGGDRLETMGYQLEHCHHSEADDGGGPSQRNTERHK